MRYVDTGIPSFNLMLSGGSGLELGKMYEIFGESSTAKSTIAQYLMIKFKEQFSKGVALYIDTEQAFDLVRFAYMKGDSGISVFKSLVVEETLSKIMDVLNKSITDKYPTFIVWDTVAASIMKANEGASILSAGVAAKPRLLNSVLPLIIKLLVKSGSVLILLNQVYANIKSRFGGVKTKGGRGIEYFSSVRLQVRRLKDYERIVSGATIPEAIGVIVKTIKNKIFFPRMEGYLYIHNERGIQPLESLIEQLKEDKIVSVMGAWKRLKIGEDIDFKFNTVKSFKDKLDSNPLIFLNIEYLIYKKYMNISTLARIKLIPKFNEIEKKLKMPLTKLTKAEKELLKVERDIVVEE